MFTPPRSLPVRRATAIDGGSKPLVTPYLRGWAFALSVCVWLLFAPSAARASVAVLLEQPYGGMGAFNPTGHSALYFDHICADTPVRLRPCLPGEPGVVISRYDGIGTLDWVAVPLVPYLYAVESPDEIPAGVDRLTALRLRDLYRREHLQAIAPDTPQGGMPQGNWYELVGSAFDRTIYGFQVNTTAAQDAEIIARFNDRPNVTRYSGAFRNCADFVRTTVNLLYPHAIRRNFVADVGLTTPKEVAKSLTSYAKKHPDVGFQVFQIRQTPGALPRSVGVEGVTESLLKRYGVPLALLSPHVTAVVLIAYLGRGRFSVPKDAPALDVEMLTRSSRAAHEDVAETDPAGAEANRFQRSFEGYETEFPVAHAAPEGIASAPRSGTFDRGTVDAVGRPGEGIPGAEDVLCPACSRFQALP